MVLAKLTHAQDTPVLKGPILNARIQTTGGRLNEGYVYAVSDTALLLSPFKRRLNINDTASRDGLRSYPFRDLEYVTIHRNGGTGRSVLIGLCIGAVTGAVAGFASGDDPSSQFIRLSAGEKAFGVGVFGGMVGGLIGLVVGVGGHHTFVIKGKKEKFDNMSQKLAARMAIGN